MQPQAFSCNDLAEAIELGDVNSLVVAEISDVVQSGQSANLIESMLSRARTFATNEEDCVALVMHQLENLSLTMPDAACPLMLALQPIAGALCLHDVWDAVDLWAINNKSQVILDTLKSMVLSEIDSDNQRHLQELISRLLSKE